VEMLVGINLIALDAKERMLYVCRTLAVDCDSNLIY